VSDEQLRELYARATSNHAESRAACPSPEALLATVRREGPERERVEMLDHVMSCADCRRDFELLRAIERGRRAEAAEAAGWMRWRRPISAGLITALAASLAFVAILGPRHDWWRGGGAGDVMRNAVDDVVPLSPAADAAVHAGPLAFAWRAVAGARGYTLELLGPDGSTIVSRQTIDTTATLRDVRLAPGEYRWWVRARLAGGELRSPARRLRVEADPSR
jgi:hypothetical protein